MSVVWVPSLLAMQVPAESDGKGAPVLVERPAPDPAAGLIKLDIVVTNKSGKPVAGLGQKNITVLDSGQPAKILSFASFDENSVKPDLPVEVVLVLDTINLPDRLAKFEKVQIRRFLRQNGGRLEYPTSIFWLSDTGLWIVAKPSSDGNLLTDEIAANKPLAMNRRTLRSQRGQSLNSMTFEDPPGLAALKALGEIARYQRRKLGRKLLLWIGPGWGTGSGRHFSSNLDREQIFNGVGWFSTLMREARLVLYSFSVGEADEFLDGMDASIIPQAALYRSYLKGVRSDRDARIEDLDRKVLAVESGGRVLQPTDDLSTDILHTGLSERKPDPDLAGQMNACVAEAGTFYSVTFDPAPTKETDEYHALSLVVDQPGLTARTNTGYYDEPYFYDQPAPARKPATVAALGQMVGSEHGKHDGDVARDLSGVELTQRLSDEERSSLDAELNGKKSMAELRALADASEFLDPAPSAIGTEKAPDASQLGELIAKTLEYLNKTNPNLPNFLAMRTTMSFADSPGHYDEAARKHIDFEPLHLLTTTKATVLYRKGKEIVGSTNGKSNQSSDRKRGLVTEGTFGPILGAVGDAIAIPGGMTWDHWEHGESGRVAVFRYAVPKDKSRFEVGYCCLLQGDGAERFHMLAGYHGEMAIDPVTGAIHRLTLDADLPPRLPLARSAVMVEYGPIQIGGKTYICPVRSVSISRSLTVKVLTGFSGSFNVFGPYSTMLNEMDFEDYHVFRSEARVLSGDEPVPEPK